MTDKDKFLKLQARVVICEEKLDAIATFMEGIYKLINDICSIWEIVKTEEFPSKLEVWCYCKKCNIETFHEIPNENPKTLWIR